MTLTMLNHQQAIADVVLEHPECAAVFQRHRMDFCCGGDVSIQAAAEARDIDPNALVAELSEAIARRAGAPRHDPRVLSTARLVAHIVSTHHEYLRQTLPFVEMLATKVSEVHGGHQPELRDLRAAVAELSAALIAHLHEEEEELFPAVMARQPDPAVIDKHLGSMLADHLEVAKQLERIRALSHNFALPDWACTSYKTLFAELQRVETDTFTHVHIENHVLRPRFAAL
jgi:regulator of cell morphogenesis and NO signaling